MVRSRSERLQVSYQIAADHSVELMHLNGVDSHAETVHFRGNKIGGLDESLAPHQHLHESLLARASLPYALIEFAMSHGRVVHYESDNTRTRVQIELQHGFLEFHTVHADIVSGTAQLQLDTVAWKVEDPLLGAAHYKLSYPLQAGLNLGEYHEFYLEGPQAMRMSAQLANANPELVAEVSPWQGEWQAPATSNEIDSRTECELRWISDQLAEILIPHIESRVLALATQQGWIVMEAPVSPQVGESIIDALEDARPGLGLRYVLASHHHPHYVGAFPAFVARGATPVVPAAVAPYVEELLHRPRAGYRELWDPKHRPMKVIGVPRGERWSPPGLENQIVAIEVDGHSKHTDAFMIFSLPEHKLGFGGDLLWVHRKSNTRPTRERTLGLIKIIDQEASIQEFLTSWPAGNGSEGLSSAWHDSVARTELLSMIAIEG